MLKERVPLSLFYFVLASAVFYHRRSELSPAANRIWADTQRRQSASKALKLW